MFSQVIGPSEPLLAQLARVRLDPGVRPLVASQLVGPREPPAAVWPTTREWLLAGMST